MKRRILSLLMTALLLVCILPQASTAQSIALSNDIVAADDEAATAKTALDLVDEDELTAEALEPSYAEVPAKELIQAVNDTSLTDEDARQESADEDHGISYQPEAVSANTAIGAEDNEQALADSTNGSADADGLNNPNTITANATTIASGYCGGEGDGTNLTWTLDSNGLLTISGTGAMADWTWGDSPWFDYKLDITSVVVAEGVTTIGADAFYMAENISSVTIPSSVASIGYSSFSGCPSLASVFIPDGVESIGESAFSNCSSLSSVSIGSGVATIGLRPFIFCDSLDSVSVSPDNAFYCSVDGLVYSKDRTSLVFCPTGYSSDYDIPDGVLTICDWAFVECPKIESISIPNSVKTIGADAFHNCTGLVSVTMGEGVTRIGASAFQGCASLDGIVIPNGVTTIENLAFSYSNISSIIIPDTITAIEDWAFDGCHNLGSITVPNSVTSIGEGVFVNCTGLTTARLGNGITCIGESTFDLCSNLSEIYIPQGVTAIGNMAFTDCLSLTDVYYPGTEAQWNAISIGPYNECLTNATIHFNYDPTAVAVVASGYCGGEEDGTNLTWTLDVNGLLTIDGMGAMMEMTWNQYHHEGYPVDAPWKEYNKSIVRVGISSGVTSISRLAFRECYNLRYIQVDEDNAYYCHIDGVLFNKAATELIIYPTGPSEVSYTVPNGVTTIGEFAFADSVFRYGTEVIFPNSVTTVGAYAFASADLRQINMGDGVTTIGQYAFDHCKQLESITIPNGVTAIEPHTFACSGLSKVTMPDSVVIIGRSAFLDCHSLSRIEIPDGVTLIDEEAFASCGLSRVKFGNSVATIARNAFECNSNLAAIMMSSSISTIADDAFIDCSSLAHVYFNGTEQQWNAITIGEHNEYLTNATIHFYDPMVASELARGYCGGEGDGTNLTWVLDSQGLLTISGTGRMAASKGYLSNLGENTSWYDLNFPIERVVIESGVTSIGDDIFNGSSLKSVEIADTVAVIESFAFAYSGLESVTIPDGVGCIYDSAFLGCWNLESVTLGNTPISLGNDAFSGCRNLTSLTIGNGVTCIGYGVFNGCNIQNLLIPDSVISIGDSAFNNNGALTSVTIPASVVDIFSGVFQGCEAITDVYFSGTQEQWQAINIDSGNECLTGATIHYNCNPTAAATEAYGYLGRSGRSTSLWHLNSKGTLTLNGSMDSCSLGSAPWQNLSYKIKKVVISNSVGELKQGYFYMCHNLKQIYIPVSVTEIECKAIYYCQALDSVTVAKNNPSYWDVDGVLFGFYEYHRYSEEGELIIDQMTHLVLYPNNHGSTYDVPAGTDAIENYAFSRCGALISLSIPRGTGFNTFNTSLCFEGCYSLESINVADDHEWLFDIDGVVFVRDYYNGLMYNPEDEDLDRVGLLFYPYAHGETYAVPQGITDIAEFSFMNSGITHIAIPDGVLAIWECTFEGCASLETMVLTSDIEVIEGSAFKDCDSLSHVFFMGTEEQWNVISIGWNNECLTNATIHFNYDPAVGTVFDSGYCGGEGDGTNLSWSVDYFGTLTISGTGTMADWSESFAPWLRHSDFINNIVVEDGVSTITSGAFSYCDANTVSISQSVDYISYTAFYDCRVNSFDVDENNSSYCDIEGVLFNKSATELMKYASGGSRRDYSIPNGVVIIKSHAFYMYGVNSITIPNSVEIIEDEAFFESGGYSIITIPGSVQSIGKSAFAYHQTLRSVVIEEGVKTIGDFAFNFCGRLTNATIPASVTTIGRGIFNDCTCFTDVYYGGTQEQWNAIDIADPNYPEQAKLANATIHYSIDPTETIIIDSGTCGGEGDGSNVTWTLDSEGVLTISGSGAMESYADETQAPWYNRNQMVTKVVIAEGVTTIGEAAFAGCDELESVTIPQSVTAIGANAFSECQNLSQVNYSGTQEQWEQIESGSDNEDLTNTSIQYDYVAYILGDVDGDDKINSADAALILRWVVKLAQNSDINLQAAKVTSGTGDPTSADAAQILRYVVGLIPML